MAINRIGLQITEGCDLACRHCGTFSSPKVQSVLSPEIAHRVIDQLADFTTLGTVGFTGGEVFTVEDYLWELVDHVRARGMTYSIVTNASWADDPERASSILGNLRDCVRLGLSSDNYHSPAVPKRQVGDALRRALDLGVNAVIRYTYSLGETEESIWDDLGTASAEERERVLIGPVMPMGRARNLLLREDVFPVEEEGPCSAASIIMVKSTGEAFACCGESLYMTGDHALRIGHLRHDSLASLMKRHGASPIVQAMRTIGPRKLAVLSGVVGDTKADEIKCRSSCGSCALCFSTSETSQRVKVAVEADLDRVQSLRALYYGEV